MKGELLFPPKKPPQLPKLFFCFLFLSFSGNMITHPAIHPHDEDSRKNADIPVQYHPAKSLDAERFRSRTILVTTAFFCLFVFGLHHNNNFTSLDETYEEDTTTTPGRPIIPDIPIGVPIHAPIIVGGVGGRGDSGDTTRERGRNKEDEDEKRRDRGGGISYPLNITCSSSLYPTLFYNDTCSPAFCSSISDKTTPSCTYPAVTFTTTAANQEIMKNKCRTCTVPADARCSSTVLKATLGHLSGIQAVYCNDQYMIVWGDGSTGSIPNLDNVPLPPGGTQSGTGTQCRTRMASYVNFGGRIAATRIKLCPTMLSTSLPSNNLASFPAGAVDSPYGYLANGATVYGLPSGGAVGTSITGQQVFPTFNNRALYTPENCEVDHCNQHIGQGGGYPHTHGDSFGPNCLYSEKNYTSIDAHPPLVGWSFDGYSIYGRYLSVNAPGYSTPLDDCGGHIHEGNDYYHYHTQVLSLTTSGQSVQGISAGQAYMASTVGPHKCWKGDISADMYFWKNRSESMWANAPCCGATQYYTSTGITIDGAGTQSFATVTGSACGASPSPTPSVSAVAASPTSSPSTSAAAAGGGTTIAASPTPSPSSSTAASGSSPSPSPSTSTVAGTASSSSPSSTSTTAGGGDASPSSSSVATPTTSLAAVAASSSPSSTISTSTSASPRPKEPTPVLRVELKLRPAAPMGNVSAIILGSSGIGINIRKALVNATGLNMTFVKIISITTGSSVILVAANDSVNTASGMRRLLEVENDSSSFVPIMTHFRELQAAADSTVVTTEISVPADASTTSITSLKTTISAVQSGAISASSIGLGSSFSALYASFVGGGAVPQPLEISSMDMSSSNGGGGGTSAAAAADTGISTGAIIGILVGGIVAVGILSFLVYHFKSSSAANGKRGSSVLSSKAADPPQQHPHGEEGGASSSSTAGPKVVVMKQSSMKNMMVVNSVVKGPAMSFQATKV